MRRWAGDNQRSRGRRGSSSGAQPTPRSARRVVAVQPRDRGRDRGERRRPRPRDLPRGHGLARRRADPAQRAVLRRVRRRARSCASRRTDAGRRTSSAAAGTSSTSSSSARSSIPGVREQAQLLRLLRLARIVRLVRFLPDARMLILTVVKSIPAGREHGGADGPAALRLRHGRLVAVRRGPAGDLGHHRPVDAHAVRPADARELPDVPHEAEPVSVLAVPFFVSYVLLAAFIVFNLLIGVVISSMEKAREEEDEARAGRRRRDARAPGRGAVGRCPGSSRTCAAAIALRRVADARTRSATDRGLDMCVVSATLRPSAE